MAQEQVKTPAEAKPERFVINPSSTGITEADGSGANFKAIWDYKVPTNQWLIIDPRSVFATSLVGDDAAAMPAGTRVRVVKRDVTGEDELTIMPENNYQSFKEFRDVKLQARFQNLGAPVEISPEEHIIVQVAGVDAATTGDTDASASNFNIICTRRKKPLR